MQKVDQFIQGRLFRGYVGYKRRYEEYATVATSPSCFNSYLAHPPPARRIVLQARHEARVSYQGIVFFLSYITC